MKAPRPAYQRYAIPTEPTPDVARVSPRFRVKVKKHRLIALAIQEVVHARGNLRVALSRPCMYGVFGRPVGGLAPREDLCVACLRCTVEYPEVVQIVRNPVRELLAVPGISADEVDTLLYESRTGRVPVRGAGYRGPFGGSGWDGMWLDMSEIVRPTRDGIHGREHISTVVDVGERAPFLAFDAAGAPVGPLPRGRAISVPFVLGPAPPGERAGEVQGVLLDAARRLGTLAVVPLPTILERGLAGPDVVPLVGTEDLSLLDRLPAPPAVIEMNGWDPVRHAAIAGRFPDGIISVRVPLGSDAVALVRAGAGVIHLAAPDWAAAAASLPDDIRRTHLTLVEAGVRDEITLLGSGAVRVAEHIPKAIACGLDAVVLDVPLWVALQARRRPGRGTAGVGAAGSWVFPRASEEWAVRRILNLAASWRDQLIEVLGAMGLREVRRLRGELGRCMFQADLEREAFGAIDGYPA